jgi:hypothetical protein
MTAANVAPDRLVRVEKGRATPEELGALVAVLLARGAAARHAAEAARTIRPGPGWHREVAPRFRVPHSWQAVSWW